MAKVHSVTRCNLILRLEKARLEILPISLPNVWLEAAQRGTTACSLSEGRARKAVRVSS